MRKLGRLTIDEHREVADILARTRATLVNADVLSRFKRYREQVVDEAATRYFSCRLPCPHTTVLAFLAPELVRQPSRDDCLGASASLGCAMLGLSI
jgi:hypothetical protein